MKTTFFLAVGFFMLMNIALADLGDTPISYDQNVSVNVAISNQVHGNFIILPIGPEHCSAQSSITTTHQNNSDTDDDERVVGQVWSINGGEQAVLTILESLVRQNDSNRSRSQLFYNVDLTGTSIFPPKLEINHFYLQDDGNYFLSGTYSSHLKQMSTPNQQ